MMTWLNHYKLSVCGFVIGYTSVRVLSKSHHSFEIGYHMLACVVRMMSSTKEEPAIGFHSDLQRAAIISKA